MDTPLSITAQGIGKRHGRTWIWRNVDGRVEPGGTLALLGENGSGKSSLLRVLCGFESHSEGEVTWMVAGQSISRESLPGHIAYCAPDQDLIADLTVREHIDFHRQCRIPTAEFTPEDAIRLALLEGKEDRRVGALSSGMRQRLALVLAFTTPSAALFLDEPTSHLDERGRLWYRDLLDRHRHGRTLVVASNQDREEVPSGAPSVILGLQS